MDILTSTQVQIVAFAISTVTSDVFKRIIKTRRTIETTVTLQKGALVYCVISKDLRSWTYIPPMLKIAHRVIFWDLGICDPHTSKIGMSKRSPSVMIWGIELPTELAN